MVIQQEAEFQTLSRRLEETGARKPMHMRLKERLSVDHAKELITSFQYYRQARESISLDPSIFLSEEEAMMEELRALPMGNFVDQIASLRHMSDKVDMQDARQWERLLERISAIEVERSSALNKVTRAVLGQMYEISEQSVGLEAALVTKCLRDCFGHDPTLTQAATYDP